VIGALSLVGMAAVVSATTHAPLMASVLAFELSGDYALVVPLLVASALATLVSRRLGLDSLYVREALRPDEPSR
jgi:CIC family chloride channel protein